MGMKETIAQLREQITQELAGAQDKQALEAWKRKH